MSQERRKSKRRPILDSFSLFVVIPKKGPLKLRIHDVSDTGLSFDVDTEGDEAASFPLKIGETFEVHLYLNQSLYLPLQIRIARLSEKDSIRQVGAEYAEKGSKEFDAFRGFVQMIDHVTEVARLNLSKS